MNTWYLVHVALQLRQPGRPVAIRLELHSAFGKEEFRAPMDLSVPESTLTKLAAARGSHTWDERDVVEWVRSEYGPNTPEILTEERNDES